MRTRLPKLLGMAALAAVAAAGCSDGTVTGVQAAADGAPRAAVIETCQAIDFNGFAHGGAINSVSALGLALSVTSAPFVHPNGSPNLNTTPRAFDAGVNAADWEDKDLIDDLSGGSCADCGPLARMLVMEDERGFPFYGDYAYGGMLTLSGTFAGGDYYVKSFKAVDVDATEQVMRFYVDGVLTAQSGATGNGTVQTVNVATPHTIAGSFAFAMGTDGGNYSQTGSGAIDDIMLCRLQQEEEPGDEGCTLGYWKQEHHLDSWAATGYTPAQTLESVFSVPDAFGLDNVSLLSALDFTGGPGATAAARLLLKQAVASVLNAAHPDVDFELTTAQVIAQVDAALATGNRDTMLALAAQLDGFNNAGCPLN